ncbi:MAG: hypothetical protein BWY21_01464 [Parcubacteria group bacterium ADurb.Bin216]|nr:MAG: hypothetical protein BWY21_01464 [Parcubacteria group bacterium ADurb.Bin216]
MAVTISTSQDWDSAARAAGEAITIQSGAVLTVNTDTRYHKNAPASGTGTFGEITMTSATGGELLIDGRSVRWLPYTGGTGNAPAYDTDIVGDSSGATGKLLGVYTTLSSAPIAVGAAINATGFIKLKSASTAYNASETLTGISASTNGVDVTGWIEVVADDLANITIARAQKLTVRSDWFYLDNTTGVAQIIQLPTCGGGANTMYPGVWIETAEDSGVYEFWPAQRYGGAVSSGWYTTAKGTDARSKFVEMQDGGAIRIGANTSGAYGFIPDANCRVRIPNVLMMSCATATRASNSLPHATVTSRPQITTDSAGNIDINGCLSTWYFNVVQAYSVTIKNTAIVDNFAITECATSFTLEEFHTGNYLNTDVSNATFTSNFAGGTVTKCKFGRCGAAGNSDYGTYIACCKDITFTDCHFQTRIRRTTAGTYACAIACCDNIKFIRPVIVGSSLYCSASTNNYIENPVYADSYNDVSSDTGGSVLGVVYLAAGCVNNEIKGGTFWSGISDMHPDVAYVYATGTTNTRWHTCGTPASPIDGGTTNSMHYALQDGGNNIGIEIKRVYFTNIATRFYTSTNSSKGVLIENCAGDYAGTNTFCDSLDWIIKGLAVSAMDTAFTCVYGSIFYNIFTAATTGRVGLCFNEDTATYAAYVNKTGLTGASGFSSAGTLYLYNLNDVIEYEFPYYILGYTSFDASNVVIAGGNTGNLGVKYKIDVNDGNGYSATWEDATSANLTGETIDEDLGFKLKIQITCTTAGTNYLNSLYFAMVTDATAQYTNYPLDVYTLSLTGLQTGTKVAILATGTETPLTVLTESGGSVSYTYPDTAVTDEVDIAILAAGYLYQKIEAYALTATNASIPIIQNVDYGYVALSSETVTFNGSTKRIICDAATTEIDVVGVYSMWVDWALTSDNLKYKHCFNELGGNTIDSGAGTSVPVYGFLVNSWKVTPDDANHTLAVTGGILLVDGGGDPFDDVTGRTIRINYQQPVQAITVSTGGTVAPSASEIRDAIGLAAADLDDQIGAIPTAAEINAEVDTALSDYDPPTKAELDSAIATVVVPTVEEIRTEMDDNSTELASIKGKTNLIPGLF